MMQKQISRKVLVVKLLFQLSEGAMHPPAHLPLYRGPCLQKLVKPM